MHAKLDLLQVLAIQDESGRNDHQAVRWCPIEGSHTLLILDREAQRETAIMDAK